MIVALFGNLNRERVLIFLYVRGSGNASEITRFYQTDLSPVQNQLEKLEMGGILSSRLVGKTRLYEWNPRYPLLLELQSLLEKMWWFYPESEKKKWVSARTRPRRKGKPL